MLKLPPESLQEEEIKHISPHERGAYIERFIEKVLDLNTDTGATPEDIFKSTGMDRRITSKYLEVLVAKRMAYKTIQGNTITYFKNGRLLHHIFNKRDVAIGNRSFSFKALFDGHEVLIYIQENKKNPLGLIEEGGGIIVPLKNFDEFVSSVSKVKNEIPTIKDKFLELVELKE